MDRLDPTCIVQNTLSGGGLPAIYMGLVMLIECFIFSSDVTHSYSNIPNSGESCCFFRRKVIDDGLLSKVIGFCSLFETSRVSPSTGNSQDKRTLPRLRQTAVFWLAIVGLRGTCGLAGGGEKLWRRNESSWRGKAGEEMQHIEREYSVVFECSRRQQTAFFTPATRYENHSSMG